MVSMAQRKPEGGFQFISVVQLCMVWQAYHTAVIRKGDVRVWFAAHELVARRCQLKPGQQPTYTCEELSQIIGGEGEVSASLARLQACGLLRWNPQAVSFPSHPTPEHSFVGLPAMLAQIPNHRRQVPVPRRLLRFIAGGCRRAVLATILGHLFRCLYYHQGQCKPEGLCKAAWIAEVFGISVRSVKDGRQHLEEFGVVLRAETPQWVRNRYGQKMVMNLQWAGPPLRTTAPGAPPESAPLPAVSTTESAPPDSYQKLPTGKEHQKPACGEPSGVLHTLVQQAREALPVGAAPLNEPEFVEQRPISAPLQRKQPATSMKMLPARKTPTLSHITLEDLTDTGRLLALYTHAIQAQLTGPSEAERLTFVALAQHVMRYGPENAGGLFLQLLKQQRFDYITQGDEDTARQRLRQALYGLAWAAA